MKPPIDWLAIGVRWVLGMIAFTVAVMLLGLLALVAGPAHAQTLSLAPSPAIVSDPYPASGPQPAGFELTLDGAVLPGCAAETVAPGSVRLRCPASGIAAGAHTATAVAIAANGTRSAPSAPFHFTLTRNCTQTQGGKLVTCTLAFDHTDKVAPAVTYATLGGYVYTANGAALTLAQPIRKAAAALACDCTTPIMSNGIRYCAFAGAPAPQVSACIPKP